MPAVARDFYEIQKSQRAKSFFLFIAVIAFYFAALGFIALIFLLVVSLFFGGGMLASSAFWFRFFVIDLAAATVSGGLHFLDAKRNGPRYILKRLQAVIPDPNDRYHKQFLDTLDEIRIAAGLPRVNAYVLPSFAINSLALVEEGRTPAVAVTEGLLADGTRDELQAVAAHELAHIARGDAFTLTLVCSLANIFEKLCEALEPEDDDFRGTRAPGSSSGTSRISPAFFYFAVSLSALIMHLLSTLVSRERELLADAAAVEFCRSPDSLARIIYKAQVKNSFIGNFSMTYAPLFIVPPDSRDIPDTPAGRIFNTHPPFMKRLGLLAAMAAKTPEEIIAEVRESEAQREQARGVIHSFDEIRKRQLELFPDLKREANAEAAPAPIGAAEAPSPLNAPGGGPAVSGSHIWLLATNLPERWEGPFTMSELLSNPRFTLLSRIKNTQERIEAKAREFPQVRVALHDPAANKPLASGRRNLCPRCHVALSETYYEGVPVGFCTSCTGKLVEMATVDRIIVRREVAFSDDLLAKAQAFRNRVQLNPVERRKINDSLTERIPCPYCGYGMVARPYNYEYFVPVDKCLACSRIWFDADELEILQILIEEQQPA